MAHETLIVEIMDHSCLIRLNRPEAMNALNTVLMKELARAMREADQNDKVRCIILTGSEKVFAAGTDIKEMAGKSFADMFFDNLFAADIAAISAVRKPLIAAVSGHCLGGGCELAMLCDFIVAADNAKFGQPEINLGIVAGMGGTQRLPRLVGKSKAMDMHLTGRFMEAAEAERAGLVSRVFPARDLMEETLKIAARIAEKSRLTAMLVKEAVDQSQNSNLPEGLLFERRLFHAAFASEDQKEGMAAFLEKRQPQFRDR